MDIEELSTTQVILLVLLVSFVTSIATGIITVTLLAQAPPAVTQTINRVVERTVQTVVPDTSHQAAAVITKETTVVVKEDDLITDSITKNASRIARIHSGSSTSTPVVGLGLLLDAGGTLVTDAAIIPNTDWAYTAELADGTSFALILQGKDEAAGLVFLIPSLKKGETIPATNAIVFGKDTALKLGSTALALSGASRTKVSTGVITDIDTTDAPALITASVGSDILPGTPLINIYGELVGISTGFSRATSATTFIVSGVIAKDIAPPAATSTPAKK